MASYGSFSKEARFRDLCEAVKHCSLCSRLFNRNKVLSEANGNLWSKVLFIAEAPGRLGADKTGIPLFGDKTGDNFESLLGNIGWRREDIFITNAVLCNPREEKGTNDTPTVEEIANCAPYLEMTIEVIQPEVIVSLGSTALRALANITPHNFSLKKNVGHPIAWRNKVLIPLYHPGPRVQVHRSYPKQTSDFIALAKVVDPRSGLKRGKLPKTMGTEDIEPYARPTELQKLVSAVVWSLGSITYFKLTKLLYLIDLTALERIGRTVTGEIYLRQQEGPWPPALRRMISSLEGREILLSFRGRIPVVKPGPSPAIELDFDDREVEIIGEILERYGHLDNTRIKGAVYRTPPMIYILKQEKLKRDMRKVPVIYKDRTAPDLDRVS